MRNRPEEGERTDGLIKAEESNGAVIPKVNFMLAGRLARDETKRCLVAKETTVMELSSVQKRSKQVVN